MSLILNGRLLLAGAGKMGGAMLAGWLDRGLDPRQVVVQDPAPPPETAALLSRHGIEVRQSPAPLSEPPAVIVVAVKPQIMDQVFPALAASAGAQTLVLSVAAGKTIASFAAHLPAGTAVVRSIPNTPAAIGRGITVCCANAHVSRAQREVCHALLSAVGEVGWVEDEGLIDAATAVSGSGPAYVFLLAECLAEAGRAVGLEPGLARRLANATVSGSGELLRQSGLEPPTLRQNVTSPGGTTAAALAVLMGPDGLQPLLTRAVEAAARRSRELSS
ncbi:MAG: pyrroline-5-carboxylate reductase [Hyphomicrobiaceae bacterium]|nr:pyrroline-5-carboxylate reductase [Hyphomicrobiaceae bacterium]